MLRSILIIGLLFVAGIANGVRPDRLRKLKFDMCRGNGRLNPVVAMRSRVLVTKTVARCGTSVIVHFASRYKTSHRAIDRITWLICFGTMLTYGLLASGNGMEVPKEVSARDLMSQYSLVINFAYETSYGLILDKDTGAPFMPPAAFRAFTTTMMQCVFNSTEVIRDGNQFLGVVRYYRGLL